MTKPALIYAWIVIAVGNLVLAAAAPGWQSWDDKAFLVCLGLALLASTFKVKLPMLTGTISPGFVFVLVSVATRSWSETVVIATISGPVQCIWLAKTRPSTLQLCFNAATMAISGGVAHGTTQELQAMGGSDVLVVVMGVAGVALLISNTLMVSAILCLTKEAPFYTAWRSMQLWSVPYYFAGGVLATVWARAEIAASIGVIPLAASSVYLLSTCYQELFLRLQRYSTSI